MLWKHQSAPVSPLLKSPWQFPMTLSWNLKSSAQPSRSSCSAPALSPALFLLPFSLEFTIVQSSWPSCCHSDKLSRLLPHNLPLILLHQERSSLGYSWGSLYPFCQASRVTSPGWPALTTFLKIVPSSLSIPLPCLTFFIVLSTVFTFFFFI